MHPHMHAIMQIPCTPISSCTFHAPQCHHAHSMHPHAIMHIPCTPFHHAHSMHPHAIMHIPCTSDTITLACISPWRLSGLPAVPFAPFSRPRSSVASPSHDPARSPSLSERRSPHGQFDPSTEKIQ